MLHHRQYVCGDVVYHSHEQAWNLFLVTAGTFANVGRPGPLGGCCPPLHGREDDHISCYSASISMPGIGGVGSVNPTLLTKMRSFVKEKPGHHKSKSCRGFYPYQLFGRNTYFGDTEIFENVERRSSVRCESSSNGSLLLLHKKDFQQLVEDYPSFRYLWLSNAKKREVRRKVLLRRLTAGQQLKHFAANIIQEHFRSLQPARKVVPVSSPTTPTSSPASSAGIASAVRLPRSLPAAGPYPRTTYHAAAPEHVAVAALRQDVDCLRKEMRASFEQLQQCMQGVSARPRATTRL